MRRRTIVIALLLLVIPLVALYLFLIGISSQITSAPVNNATPVFTYKVLDDGLLDHAGGEQDKVVYIIGDTEATDVRSIGINVSLFPNEVPSDIYLLDYSSPGFAGCVECSSMGEFRQSLELELKKYSLIPKESTLNLIKPNQLETLTKKAVVIVATGKIPSFLVGLESGVDLNTLINNGVVVIYVGSDFTNSLNKDGTASLIQEDVMSKYNIGFFAARISCSDGIELAQPSFLLHSGQWQTIHGCISVSKGNRSMVVLPRSLDIGWSYNGTANGTAAAKDVARLIYEVAWQDAFTNGNTEIYADASNAIKYNTSTVFLNPSTHESGFARIFLQAEALNGSIVYASYNQLITGNVSGHLLHPLSATNGVVITVTAEINENFTTAKQVNLSLVAYKDLKELGNQSFAQVKIGNVSYSTSSLYAVNLPEGDAILKLVDESGHVYAQSLLHIPEVTVGLLSSPSDDTAWNNGEFRFQVLSDGSPVPGRVIVITANNSPSHDLTSPAVLTTDSNGRFMYATPKSLPYGNYTFKINVTGKSISLYVTRTKPPSFLDNWLNQVLIVITVLILVVGVLVARPEKPVYTIDVPEFPPAEKVMVPFSKSSVTGLFDSVNRDYKWRFMPLNLQELKKEFRKNLNYQGVPIVITDYNLEKLLDQLIRSNDVSKAANLYGLKAWEAESKKSITYLSLFRLLRTFFTNNAISFTELGQREDCDMMAIVKGENTYMHIYQNDETVTKALSLANQGYNYIVFESEDALEKFQGRLEMSSKELAVLLKLELESGRIKLLHPGNFDAILGKSA